MLIMPRLRLVVTALGVLALAPFTLQGQEAHTHIGAFVLDASRESDGSNRNAVLTPAIVAESSDNAQEMGLAWKCMDDGMHVLVLFGKYLGGDSDDRVEVKYSFNNGDWSPEVKWQTSNNRVGFLPMNEVASFTESARNSQLVSVMITDPLDGEVLGAKFSVAGLADALQAVEPCTAGN